MEKELNILKITRNNIIKTIDGLSIEELNKVPEGYNNNIAWNVGHLMVTQQLLCYKMSGLPVKYEASIIDDLKKGASPSQAYKNVDMTFFKNELLNTADSLEEDYNNGKFKEFTPYMTSYGFELKSIEDAIIFNNLHEALHFGYIMAMKRAL